MYTYKFSKFMFCVKLDCDLEIYNWYNYLSKTDTFEELAL